MDQHSPPRGFTNPILPGWNPDPSCIFVPEWDNTFFCVTSSFMIFPGLPLYSSKDLVNWKLGCNILNRRRQVPELGLHEAQDNGIFAPTIRYHDKRFYVIVEYVTIGDAEASFGLVFSSSDPFDPDSWTDPLVFRQPQLILDPDIFWDDDGRVLVQAASFRQEIVQFEIDLGTGATGPEKTLWKGTGGIAPEGPHLYKKDGWYYLLIAEGGTDLPHCVTIARSRSPSGPFEGFADNPILTNRNTSEYFQTIGHADFFRDGDGNWWGVALATRSGPEYVNYPMGRETVLFPVSWAENDWPRPEPVRGRMNTLYLPKSDPGIIGFRQLVDEGDELDFSVGSNLPLHFVHWRFPPEGSVTISPPGHVKSLRLVSSQQSLAGKFKDGQGLTFVGRRQTSTLFNFSIELQSPLILYENEEVGVTVFLTELQHASIGVTWARSEHSVLRPHLRFRQTGSCSDDDLTPIPDSSSGRIKLSIKTENALEYAFSVIILDENSQDRGFYMSRTAPTSTTSGGAGRWGGSLLGVYATTNGGLDKSEVHVSCWMYENLGQMISSTEVIRPSRDG
ncbi:GH43-C2 domain-containing protein [Fusarium keratoplasticum]|uniref:GH43-C2 domain-containing protein n=1 Tax=Fusarium keratoplasticum TaxID=1328300 RepID=A0ACC0R4V8_9HYPO|nr:GH43-C2 domain-containing protein [Fusarium keratoplasticum]KAI8674682.1 GH43-C2 domain-containing protein [Fusarium keratoplasticum]